MLITDDPKISVVIPCVFSDEFYLLSLIPTLFRLSKEVVEIIIIVNDSRGRTFKSIDTLNNITIHYVSQPLMPGGARNYGLSFVKTDYVAFLDVKTVPPSDWLSTSKRLILDGNNINGFLGRVTYSASTFVSSCFLLATYGLKPLFCIPGSVLHRQTLSKVGEFLPFARAAEDVEWMKRASAMGYSLYNPSVPAISYQIATHFSLPNATRKWYRNYLSSAAIPYIYYVQKTAYLFFAALFLLMVALVWNWQVADWNQSSLFYIPYIFRAVLITLSAAYVLVRGVFLPLRKGARVGFSYPLAPFLVLIISFILDVAKLFAFISIFFVSVNESRAILDRGSQL